MIQVRNIVSKTTILMLVAATALPALMQGFVGAAPLTETEVRFDRMKISAPTTGTVCTKPATVGTETTVQVTFPTGYTLGAFGTFTVNTTNTAWPTSGTAWPGILTATNVTGQVVTFPSGDLTVGTLYCFNWANSAAVTVKASATTSNGGTVATYIAGPTLLDSSPFSTASIADDQIVVNAAVPQAFSFALSANSDTLPTLSTGAVATSPTPRTVTINTNAANGWQVWAKDANVGLTSANASKTIGSTTVGTNSTLVAGTEGYNMGVTSTNGGGSGTINVATPFVGGVLGKGNGLNTSLATVATANGTATNHVLTLNNNAAIAGSTPAGLDYTDTITVVGAGIF